MFRPRTDLPAVPCGFFSRSAAVDGVDAVLATSARNKNTAHYLAKNNYSKSCLFIDIQHTICTGITRHNRQFGEFQLNFNALPALRPA